MDKESELKGIRKTISADEIGNSQEKEINLWTSQSFANQTFGTAHFCNTKERVEHF